VAERGALARALRADGRREEAAEVAGLRKPSVAAWAVNQLVRTQGRAANELFDAGDAVGAAQADLVAGRGDARALRAAVERERSAVDALLDAARGLLTSQGHELSAAVLDRVADTLHAAAVDEDARANVRGGRLERELRHLGFGVGEGAQALPAPAAAKPSKPAKGAGARERAEAERVEHERAKARKAARAAAAEARRLADRAGRALRDAEARRERAAQALGEADDALTSAAEAAEAAEAAHRRAQEDLESA
jgi:hypothetical protein